MSLNTEVRFISLADARAAVQAFRRACLEWPPEVLAHEVSHALLEGQEPDAAVARTTQQGIVRVIDHYLTDGHPPGGLPEWLTPAVSQRISARLGIRPS
jgi:hypothetical protein